MAAGTSSRFVPLSEEYPKGLLNVRGEILVDRQIRQLQEAGINDITIVVGFMSSMFSYLKDKFCVDIVMNEDYNRFNNVSSIYRVLDRLYNTFICSSDNYFPNNIFNKYSTESFYCAQYATGHTDEYCFDIDDKGYIQNVRVGGENSWYMIGPAFFNYDFSSRFREIMLKEYTMPETKQMYWEDIYIKHISELRMRVEKFGPNDLFEFDSLDELRSFDITYQDNTRSNIIRKIATELSCPEHVLHSFKRINIKEKRLAFSFKKEDVSYEYIDGVITKINENSSNISGT